MTHASKPHYSCKLLLHLNREIINQLSSYRNKRVHSYAYTIEVSRINYLWKFYPCQGKFQEPVHTYSRYLEVWLSVYMIPLGLAFLLKPPKKYRQGLIEKSFGAKERNLFEPRGLADCKQGFWRSIGELLSSFTQRPAKVSQHCTRLPSISSNSSFDTY